MLGFLSFRARILSTLLILILGVQGAGLGAVYFATAPSARTQINEGLSGSARVFDALMDRREVELAQAASLVSGDFAFKTAYSLRHVPTMATALKNLRDRIHADVAVMVGLDRIPFAGDPDIADPTAARAFIHLADLAAATRNGTASSIEFVQGRPLQLVAVPLMAPVPVAWILLGFKISDELAGELKELTGAEVTFGRGAGSGWNVIASTLAPPLRSDLANGLAKFAGTLAATFDMALLGQQYVTLTTGLATVGEPLEVVLQRRLSDALAPYEGLRVFLLGLTVVGLIISVLGASIIARQVTHPVSRLAGAVKKVAAGDYTVRAGVRRKDELGDLATAFNEMTRGLAERDRVQDLLGKVVSPEVAARMLAGGGIELGGEERTVTVLFTDIRGFTRMSESLPPAELVAVLNGYLVALSNVIEANGGVVDKFIGDATMAIFGAPLEQPDHATRAVRTALAMHKALTDLNKGLAERGRPKLWFGIGVNSSPVVAGNMGSGRRMNYTVIGDGVNVASRVEKLTRIYEVPAIVTAATRMSAKGFVMRELDRVRVRGRDEVLHIYEPLGEEGALSDETLARLDTWHVALKQYRSRNWTGADHALEVLQRGEPGSRLYALFRERIETLRLAPPGAAWDGTFTPEN